jgi:hypothetical protein
MTQEELSQLHQEARVELGRYPGVFSVGFGFRERGGETTTELAFRVYVTEKKDSSLLGPDEVLPREFKGIAVDVLPLPELRKAHCEDTVIHGTLFSGISISNMRPGPTGYGAGTLGFFATIHGREGPDNVAIVSNNHVLMENGAQVGADIHQPQIIEVGGVRGVDIGTPNAIGRIHDAGLDGPHPYRYSGDPPNTQYFVDCACAKVNICISSWCGTNCGVSCANRLRDLSVNGASTITDVGRVSHADLAGLPAGTHYTVHKSGRRTGATEGKVIDVAFTPEAGMPNVILIEATRPDCDNILRFAEQGDSGAALLDAQGRLIGLVYAISKSDPRRAYACHIAPVLDKLHLTPITRANPHRAVSTLADPPGAIVEDLPNQTERLKAKLHATEEGRRLAALVDAHRHEVVHLVNHCRPVTVAWHRGRGPAFLNHLVNNARSPEVRVPRSIEGVTREELLRSMARVLTTHGSEPLRAAIARHQEVVLPATADFEDLHVLVDQLGPGRFV